ncbi:MAG: protein kinase [Myxococcaceae bacterium]|nr:protein kinase [Myxococcaceae bacterium]
MSQDATVLDVGARVGDTYEVVRLLGRGGMGEVWAARHLRLPGKQVAIKVLHTRVGGLTEEQLTRFKREADVATRIGHPNIVEVHDYNTLPSGSPYLVLELLQGESLASRLRFGVMPVDEVTLVLRQVGSALDASHQLGVVHRDLKPDNIFLVPTPMGTQVKVLDFGISKVVDSTTLQTADKVLVGTPQYMSPEQATGQNSDVGPQTDVFALGSIAYEMLSGQPAFSAENVAQILFRIAYAPHVPLEQVKPGLPPRVYAAVERALEKDRAKRFTSIADFIAAFSGQPVPRTLPPPDRATATAEPSGVARPGMATPDSLALGATAARTPAPTSSFAMPPPQRAATPAPPTKAEEAPRRSPLALFAGLGFAALAGVGAVLYVARPNVVTPLADTQPAPKPVPVPVPVPVQVEPVPPPPPQPPPPPEEVGGTGAVEPTTPKPVQAQPKVKKMSDADAVVIAEMEKRLGMTGALPRIRQLFGQLDSEPGRQRAYGIAGLAACKEQDLANSRSYLERLTDKADRAKLVAECKKLGMELVQ